VVRRYHPDYHGIYARLGWTMFDSIDRVYDSSKAARILGFTCRTGFGERLRELADRLDLQPLSRTAGEGGAQPRGLGG
jgi:UDP-glucose 4-epimerase